MLGQRRGDEVGLKELGVMESLYIENRFVFRGALCLPDPVMGAGSGK